MSNTIPLDANSRPFENIDSFAVVESRPTAFAGATTDARGDKDGTQATFTLFTVTGEVLVRIFGVCTTLLSGTTATLEVGVAGNTAALIAQTTTSAIDASELWNDSTPGVGTDTLANITGPHIIVNGLDIIFQFGKMLLKLEV